MSLVEPKFEVAYERWCASPAGEICTQLEEQALARAVGKVFGHYLVQLGAHFPTQYMNRAYVRRRFVVGPDYHGGDVSGVRSEPERLPIDSHSVDAIVLPHVLEFTTDPRAILREVDRVLLGDGKVFILTFNRLGPTGLKQSVMGAGRVPEIGKPYRVDRVVDWLGVLGFETDAVYPLMFRPRGLRRFDLLHRLSHRGMPLFSEVCLIVGRKRVAPLTPLRLERRPARKLSPVRLPQPAARTESDEQS